MVDVIFGDFEWDEEKNRKNFGKHGIVFEEACRIYEAKTWEVWSFHKPSGEERGLSIGMLDEAVTTVIYTLRNGRKRLISARQASREEREVYGEFINESG